MRNKKGKSTVVEVKADQYVAIPTTSVGDDEVVSMISLSTENDSTALFTYIDVTEFGDTERRYEKNPYLTTVFSVGYSTSIPYSPPPRQNREQEVVIVFGEPKPRKFFLDE